MKCTYRKLKESITDNTFPVLDIIEEKDYCYTTSAGQIVDISDVIPENLRYNQLRAEALVKFPELSSDINTNYVVFETRGGYQSVGTQLLTFWGKIGSQNDLKVTGESNTDVTIILDGKANKVYIGEDSQNGSGSVNDGKVQTAQLYKENETRVGYGYLKSLKLYDQSGNTDVLLAEFVPVSFNGVGAVYDKVNGKAYYANDGELGVL